MLSINIKVDFTFYLYSYNRLDFGPLTTTLTIEATYSELSIETDSESQGTIVLLPVNVKTPVVFTFSRYSVHFYILTVIRNVF